ncbi:F-box only protein 38 [Araneus ventricosus]|uniref:F-box only protein 38 n=1 Tax=Araneus ventricosus TaxID=182803 RepID=A0A4Y2DWU7_ARAVE|nr:F-box only protein 38 [Araneus ventricosus]
MIDQKHPILTDLSHELLCHILQYLPLQEVLSISMLCKKLLAAVSMHLRLCKSIDFCEGKIYGYMPSSITDDHMHSLFDKCPHLETVYGLHPLKVERRRLRKRSALTVPGIIEALSLCHNLKSVETSDLRLLEAIMQHLPQLKIIGHFQNRDGVFPPQASQRLKLLPYPRISSLHLIGVEVPELTAMPHLEHLHLQCVRFTKLQPFRAFLATKLKTFVMKHCMGPSLSLRYLSLIIALSSSPALTRLELVRVPLPGGLFQRAVEDSYRHSGFVNLKTLVISGCKGVLEADLGHLMIVASKNLERVFIQPSLTRDSLFVSLSFAQCEFPKLKDIHLGYVDKLDFSGSWSNDSLVSLGLAEVPDTPSSLTDSGMKVISELFPHIKSMSVSNCPHLMAMDQWSVRENGELQGWKELTDLTLQRCHCLQLPSFAVFLAYLPKIEVVILNDMFREPPKGCSHVGLSAGTGLGMSSAVVSNQDEHIAVQGHQQDFELQADDHMENEEMDRDFIDVDNEENPDQHIMVLQQEFFDEENHVAPAAVMQRENVDPENRIENMEQEIPENRIRRELNEDYDGESNENNAEGNNYDHKYLLIRESESSSGDEDDHSKNPNSLNEGKPLKVSRKVGTDSYDFQVIDSVNNASCSESSKHPPSQCNPSPNLFDEMMDVDSDDEEISNNLTKGKNKDKSSRSEDVNSYVKKCAHSKICTNKCSKGFDPSQPSTSRDGNCLDCSCVDFDSEMKEVETNVKDEVKSHDNHQYKNTTSAPVSTKRKRTVEINKLPDEIFQGPLTRNRKRILHQKIKKEPTFSESSNVSTANRDEVPNIPVENPLGNGYPMGSPSEIASAYIANLPIKTEPLDDEYDLNENPSDNQNINKRDQCRIPSEENISNAHDKQRPKKHKKHKHKKSKKSSKCGRLCRKRGPVTRSRSSRYLHDGHDVVSQGTQATSADIRRSLRKQRNCSLRCKRRGNGACSSSHRRSHNHISARQQMRRPKQSKPNVDVQNKSTSTSDPLMEDDAVQTLRLVSETLISLTIISCGISDIFIDHCHSLSHVEVQACRILKMFQISYCPSLKRFNISQCPKLTLEVIVPEVLSLVATKKLLVSFEPCMQIYYPSDSEKIIFSKAPLDQSIILFHDFTSPVNEAVQATAKENLLRWMEIVQKMYYSPMYLSFYKFWLLRQRQKKKRKSKVKFRENRIRYPYGHSLRRIHGIFPMPSSADPDCGKEGRYQILTNDHVFASALENKSWNKGFPAPETCEDYTEDDALLSMIETEYTERKLKMRKKIVSFYIPVSESN